jgi:hypothetical protein
MKPPSGYQTGSMNKKVLSETDICSKFITPAVTSAGWDEMAQVRREVFFTKGRIIVRGKLVLRQGRGVCLPGRGPSRRSHPPELLRDALGEEPRYYQQIAISWTDLAPLDGQTQEATPLLADHNVCGRVLEAVFHKP